ncbi:hypothetical protein K461DRAFT_277137 [Myriangium duriaei CBS 260.36]|uniref:SigF-like NTF2-like domain-containing protein n=1 Tax=Myriangium duriaei CBS 260.36 TaxID=1168546 RepID=A0A9P4J7W4_9PEZI|nr:hypothetical protein K461DRAFT_277137 [Myriangium duriaei CBS 260.36]
MDDPTSEIAGVIHALTSTPPSVQLAAINKYFTPDAEFTHPFCRTIASPSSRFQVARIYRWYKILSPQISLKVHSVSWDKANNILYVGITQIFAIWLIPFHQSEVSLVTVLHLVQQQNRLGISSEEDEDSSVVNLNANIGGKWYIKSQNDLYQTDQFIRFVLPPFAFILPLWQYFATLVCIICSYLFEPVSWWEESRQTQFERKQIPPAWNDAK